MFPYCQTAQKVGYKSKGMAKSIAAKRSKEAGIVLHVYFCSHCRSWHMSSMSKVVVRTLKALRRKRKDGL